MTPWNELAFVGVSDEPVHCGQVGQPRPEPVSRTAPPVTTITTLATTDASASSRSTLGDANHARTRCLGPAGTTELTPTGTTARRPAGPPRPRSAAWRTGAPGTRRRPARRCAARQRAPPKAGRAARRPRLTG